VAVDHSVLDALGRVRGTWQPEFVDRIITMFMENGLILIAELKKASAENDIPKLHHASHALKSCSATVGAGPLTSHCQELEAMARAGSVPDPAARVEAIAQEYLLVQAALIRRLAQPRLGSGAR
jgi:HPt (histidine-containing phosphotransfer) domain-containing protein